MKPILFNKKITKTVKGSLPFGLCVLAILSCEEFVEVDPPSREIVGETVYTDNATANASVMGIYSDLVNTQFGIGNGGPTLYGGLSSDDFMNFSSNLEQAQFFDNSLVPTNTSVMNLWSEAYTRIFAANAVIEGLEKSSEVSSALSSQLIGEALFIRSFIHFYLVNLFGDIPYITSTDFKINTNAVRILSTQVYEEIIADLQRAETLLVDDYSFSKGERVRPNRAAATAMLARVFIYTKDWAKAEAKASEVISNENMYILEENLNDVFLPNSNEAIWQLVRSTPPINTIEGYNFILTAKPTSVTLTPSLMSSFEEGDYRLANWIGSFTDEMSTYYFPFKYKIKTSETIVEYYVVLRLAEQFLIRAEARVMQGNVTGSQADLNTIRNRAGLSNSTAAILDDLLLAIGNERRVEYFAEWGHRWLDLKRTSRADAVLGSVKANWQPTDILYPIPQIQIDRNSGSFNQNSGY